MNEIYIAAKRLEKDKPLYTLTKFEHERELKHRPQEVVYRGQTLRLIPDGFFRFSTIKPDGSDSHKRFLWEHDCDTEHGEGFDKKVNAWVAYLRAELYIKHFDAKSITVCFTTFKGVKRRKDMQNVVKRALAGNEDLAAMFLFASLTEPPDPLELFLGQCWYGPYGGEPVVLLEGE